LPAAFWGWRTLSSGHDFLDKVDDGLLLDFGGFGPPDTAAPVCGLGRS
jgi:hypothetical protein